MESAEGKLIKIRPGEDSGKKPLIQEIKSEPSVEVPGVALPDSIKSLETEESSEPIKIFKPFNWEEAERVEAKHQFYHTKDNVFVNFPMKGYSKLMDIRYALSENELLVELKDPQTSKVHRLCKTLNREIDVD